MGTPDGEQEQTRKELIDLRTRTKAYAIRIIRLYAELPNSIPAQVIGKQMLRAGTSVGAHYREAIRAKSDPDFVSKLEGALQELDETHYWIELLVDTNLIAEQTLSSLLCESDELIRIFVTMVKKTKSRQTYPSKSSPANT
jgi:four helix bundle protein